MESTKISSCVLIGDDHLLLQCAGLLLNHGYSIDAIISPLIEAQDFALTREINYFDSYQSAQQFLTEREFDYLFSIINSSIIPASILQKAKKMAINFHNAPLPKYAGVHALSWALLNEESVHGVTWHEMTELVDGGNILAQHLFPIDIHETALSLSLKCYEHAICSFTELLSNLNQKQVASKIQDLSQRSYYDFRKKSLHNGLISFEEPAHAIERMVRALDLGQTHHNRLACPKIQLGNMLYIVGGLHVLSETSLTLPGTLVDIAESHWVICTRTQLIRIEKLYNIEGASCSLADLIIKHQLKKGDNLSPPCLVFSEFLQTEGEALAPFELFWVKQLLHFNPAILPFQPPSFSATDDDLVSVVNYQLESSNLSSLSSYLKNRDSVDILLATFLIYLFRMGNKENLGIWFHSEQMQVTLDKETKPSFFTELVPFSVELKAHMSFEEAINQVHHKRHLINAKKKYARDVYYRYPELRDVEHNHIPLALFLGTSKELDVILSQTNAAIVLGLNLEKLELTYWIREHLISEEPDLIYAIKASIQKFDELIKTLLVNSQLPISKLPMMDNTERSLILNQWHTTVSDYPKSQTVHQVFEEEVQKNPGHVAVTYGKKSLNYQELNQKANQLARVLQKHGLNQNTRAAICTTQELHLMIGILAILKTGAAYIPINASYPKQHIRLMLEDSQPIILLASSHLREHIKEDCFSLDIPCREFKDLMEQARHELSSNLAPSEQSPQSLAYLMYTSGTTSKPKGVMVPHQGIVRLVKNTNYIQIIKHDKIAQAANIGFDAATFEIWGALLNGATLVAVPHAILLDITKFATFLKDQQITILWLTSALFNQFSSQNPEIFQYLTYLLVGGDVLNKERIMSVLECSQGAPRFIINGYGPTENTTFTTTHHITLNDKRLATIPIGKPIANTTVYILDENGEPVSIGGVGELHTGGDGLALGYLNRPDLTNNKFIPNPLNTSTNEILYKTGDNVRWLPDGTIDYLGRVDNQVKIRGFRVELESIQAQLLHLEEISQCIIRIIESPQHKVLVAYIVCSGLTSDKDIQDRLALHLPIYMIPSFFIHLDKLPLTVNGKVNYKKLPKIDFNKVLNAETYCPPQNTRQEELTKIWSSLLNSQIIGINDNFFDLGGHSLLITQLVIQVKNTYHTDLPLHDFLEQPTIKHLDELIEHRLEARSLLGFNTVMMNDRILPIDIQLHYQITKRPSQCHILLTGATGFLGAHLLNDLIQSFSSYVYCLVRADDMEQAWQRINSTFDKYELMRPSQERIIPVLGDLSQPNLGINQSEYNMLAQTIDLIIHNGAAVNHLYNYNLLRDTNVTSTIYIMRLALEHHIKPIHYVSTLSAVNQYLNESHNIVEDFIDTQNIPAPPNDGYSQTKWVSEQLLTQGLERGLIINIYRPGWIMGNSISGAINANTNHLLMLLKGCIQLQHAPDWDIELDILPVDSVSSFISDIVLDHTKQQNTVFNLINPHKLLWRSLIEHLNLRGYFIKLVEPLIWKQDHLATIDVNNALYPLYPLYNSLSDDDWMKGLAAISRANSYNTNNLLELMGQQFPPVTKDLLNQYVDYLEQLGFLNPN